MAEVYRGTGRRKTAIARVRITPGDGKMMVNKRELSAHFGSQILEKNVTMPLQLTSNEGKFDVTARITGGGIHAQADAMKLGIARALVEFDANAAAALKKSHCLTRDARKHERHKYGQRGRRAQFQYSKR